MSIVHQKQLISVKGAISCREKTIFKMHTVMYYLDISINIFISAAVTQPCDLTISVPSCLPEASEVDFEHFQVASVVLGGHARAGLSPAGLSSAPLRRWTQRSDFLVLPREPATHWWSLPLSQFLIERSCVECPDCGGMEATSATFHPLTGASNGHRTTHSRASTALSLHPNPDLLVMDESQTFATVV
jgi:hypothetical protein